MGLGRLCWNIWFDSPPFLTVWHGSVGLTNFRGPSLSPPNLKIQNSKFEMHRPRLLRLQGGMA